MMKILVLFVALTTFLYSRGGTDPVFIEVFVKLERKDAPVFFQKLPHEAEIWAFLIDWRSGLNDDNIDYYRVYYSDKGSYSKFEDYLQNGVIFKSVEILDGNLYTISNVNVIEYYDSYSIALRVKSKYRAKAIIDPWDDFDLIKDGFYQSFYLNGTLREEKTYNEGRVTQGAHTRFHFNGNVSTTYNLDEKGGIVDTIKFFNYNGELLSFDVYKTGGLRSSYRTDEQLALDKKKKALFIGIGYYADNSYPNLNGVENDLVYTKKALSYKGFLDDNINVLKNSDATRDNIVAAFDKLFKSVSKGDVIYLHISAWADSAGILPFDHKKGTEGIPHDDVIEYLRKLQIKVGPSGQIILLSDVCNYSLSSYSQTDNGEEQIVSSGFRSALVQNKKNVLNQNHLAPLITILATGLAFEQNQEGIGVIGDISYSSYLALTNNPLFDFYDYEDEFKKAYTSINSRNEQGAVVIGNKDAPAFESQPELIVQGNDYETRGDVWMISIGINEYSYKEEPGLSFDNCVKDAEILSSFINSQFELLNNVNNAPFNFHNQLLLNDSADKEAILKEINFVISESKPNDYFVFNFSGYLTSICKDNGHSQTYFVPYGLENILDTSEVLEKGISMTQLKDLFQFIPADNQLFITEAGNTDNFSKEFTKALIESNANIVSILKRNRVIISPNGVGRDYFYCNNKYITNGPLNYFITSLPASENVFGLFEKGDIRTRTQYALQRIEGACNSFSTPYLNIFFEQEFVSDLKYYLPDGLSQSRGSITVFSENVENLKSINNKHALVIGTDNYLKAPDQWLKLANPVLDAVAVAKELENKYGYHVNLLIDPPLDSVYQALIKYANILDTNDQFILFIAGHGDFDPLLDDGMIVCSDSKSSKIDLARNSYIQYSKVSRLLNRMNPKQMLVILDVCFGGTFDEQVARNSKRSSAYDNLSAEIYLNNKMELTTRLYLTSGGKKEVPDGYKGKHSPFAYKLLEALRTGGGQYGWLSSSDMFQFVKHLPSGPLLGSFGDDEPGSEFILIPEAKSKVDEAKN